MTTHTNDTICAISSPSGQGGIGVVRISGKDSLQMLNGIFELRNADVKLHSTPHTLRIGNVVDPKTKTTIDESLVAYMRAPRSYTGEDVVEINCHGSVLVMGKILEFLQNAGCRLAHPGEFTRRAQLNGRIDLLQAEGVMDVVNARTEISLKLANKQLSGSLSSKIDVAKQHILFIWSNLEAALDFSDEDVSPLPPSEMIGEADSAIRAVQRLLDTYESGRIYSEGLRVVIAGKPNTGKSSLLNWIIDKDKAIVTDVPGTTRDVLEEDLLIEGIPVKIHDTAGIVETGDTVEQIGIDRAVSLMRDADLILYVTELGVELSQEDTLLLKGLEDVRKIVVFNKCDLVNKDERSVSLAARKTELRKLGDLEHIVVSAKQQFGLNDVHQAIAREFEAEKEHVVNDVVITKVRHKNSLSRKCQRS
jgi:tRNA modification GTPase